MAARRSLESIPQVLSANVDLDSGQADVIARVDIPDEAVTKAVEAAGFQAFKII